MPPRKKKSKGNHEAQMKASLNPPLPYWKDNDDPSISVMYITVEVRGFLWPDTKTHLGARYTLNVRWMVYKRSQETFDRLRRERLAFKVYYGEDVMKQIIKEAQRRV